MKLLDDSKYLIHLSASRSGKQNEEDLLENEETA